MNDHSQRLHPDLNSSYNKMRSKSICATQSLKIETIISPPEYEYSNHELSAINYQRSRSPSRDPGVSFQLLNNQIAN
jgi:hypothetical protein